MGMTTKHTSAANLQKTLDQKLVTIKSVSVESKDNHETREIPAEQFKNDPVKIALLNNVAKELAILEGAE